MSVRTPALIVGLGPFVGSAAAERSTVRAPADAWARPAAPADFRRALLVGTSDPHVSSLLADVLRDIKLDVRPDATARDRGHDELDPDVVLAMVDRADGVRAIGDARARFPRAPVVAILTLGTHRLGTRAVAAGASACYLLDQPIDRLRGLLGALLAAPAS